MLHKKLLSCGLAAMLCLFSAAAFAAEPTANITVNGQELVLEDLPVFDNDRILVPMRAIFEALDTFVGWDPDTQTISAQNGTSFLLLQIANPTLFKNNEKISLDTAPKIIGERTYVPLRAVSEALDCKVLWDGETRTVTVTK